MGRVIIVSNRLPVYVTRKGGELRLQQSVGGVAVGLQSLHREYGGLWIGWPGLADERGKDKRDEITRAMEERGLHPVFLTQQEIEQFYYGFCNRTIWPLFHYFTHYTVYSKRLWEAYVRVNERVADEVAAVARPDDVIWVHDYQFMLLPKLLRERRAGAAIGFFLHIPFPSFEVFRLLPWREEIVQGMAGADLVGFHTYDYVRHFLSCTRRLLGYEDALGNISGGDHVVKADAFPMGIDYDRFASAVDSPAVAREIRRIRAKVGDRKVVLSIDRLDYTKGIAERLEAFAKFLAECPEYENRVTMILVAVPSRTRVEHYVNLKSRVDELVGRINGRYGTLDWTPVWYLYRALPFTTLVALYRTADVALVTPLRDGMNLVAKEFLATRKEATGVLVLSEMAGASNVLGEAVIVNPNNRDQMIEALKTALTMPEEEQIERNKLMQARLRRYDLRRWGGDFLESLSAALDHQRELGATVFTESDKEKLVRDYVSASRRLILLDYDGTLVSFADRPAAAKPDSGLLELLGALAGEEGNEVVIISGREKSELERWFAGLDVSLVAEHGVWIRERGGEWRMIEPLVEDWKEEVRPFLEACVDKTPGSFIEEKEHSLVWHFRKVEPGLGALRAWELKDQLVNLTANLDLGVLVGSKVVEIKSAAANKGRAAMHWVGRGGWDFTLAVGDDVTDEDMFAVLPDSAYTVKVNLAPSQAKFNLESVAQVRDLLRELVGAGARAEVTPPTGLTPSVG